MDFKKFFYKSDKKTGEMRLGKKRVVLGSFIGLFILMLIGGAMGGSKDTGSGSNDVQTNANNSDTSTPVKEDILLKKGNVKLADGNIYVNNELVGTYEIVSEPPAESENVEKRKWNNKRVEIVDFRGSEADPLDYYTQYNGEWIKMSIYTNLSKTSLEITNEIYKAMQ
jgi:hypothetical protein